MKNGFLRLFLIFDSSFVVLRRMDFPPLGVLWRFSVLICLTCSGLVLAGENTVQGQAKKLAAEKSSIVNHQSSIVSKKIGVSFEIMYLSEWLSKGAEAYGQHGALFETIDIDFFGSGFGVDVTHRSATSSGYVDKQRIDYRPYYKGVMFEEERFQTNYMLSSEYEHYYGLDRHKAYTTWEWINSFSWPKLLPKGFTPTYIMHYEYPACENARYTYHSMEGWVHRFILGYDLKVPELQEPIKLTSEVAYTDGLGRAQHDWSYATFGLSTKFNINKNMIFTPAIYQQITMDHSVCKHKDVTYCTLSMKYKF